MSTAAPPAVPPEDAHCLGCEYSLRGLSTQRCPECGRPFDPGDKRTMRIGPRFGAATRILTGPIGEWARRMLLIGCAAILWGAAWLPGARYVELAGWCAACAVVCYTIPRRFLRLLLRWQLGMRRMGSITSERFSRRQLLLVALAMSSPLFWWPLRVSMFVQRPLLDHFAYYMFAQRPLIHPLTSPRPVGWLLVAGASADPHGVEMHVLGGGSIYWSENRPHGPDWSCSPVDVERWRCWTAPPTAGQWYVAPLNPWEVWLRWRWG